MEMVLVPDALCPRLLWALIVVPVQQVVVPNVYIEDKCQILVHYKTQTNIQ